MSAGTYTPAKWPIWTGPFAYGSADVTVVLLKFFSIDILRVFIVIYLGTCKDNDFLMNSLYNKMDDFE